MKVFEKHVKYTTVNSYSCLNELTEKTKNVWLVFHGIGYLSRYFLKYFSELPSEENYIVAPQAPSKYYLNGQYKHVGASWLTKESTSQETNNVFTYINEVVRIEKIPEHCNLIVFGFSQGVSIATRWVTKNKIVCSQLVLYAGGIPTELTRNNFDFMDNNTSVKIIIGNKDEYISDERLKIEKQKIKTLFKEKANLITFDGGHEVKKEIINKLV